MQIVRSDGAQIGYKHALIRSAFCCLLGTFYLLGMFLATQSMSDQEYFSQSLLQRGEALVNGSPWWVKYIGNISNVWVLAEVVTFVANKRRRALHDFMAGTVVIEKK